MAIFLGTLLFFCSIILLIGIIKPAIVIQWNIEQTRLNVLKYFGSAFAALFILTLISSGGNKENSANLEDSSRQESTSSGVKRETKKEDLYKVMDVFNTEKFEIKVVSVKARKSVGGEFFAEKAADGASFICINFQYKNISTKPTSSAIKIKHLLDPNGVEYNEATGASAVYQTDSNFNTKILSETNPGITIKDGAVFEVADILWKNKGWKVVLLTDESDIEVSIN